MRKSKTKKAKVDAVESIIQDVCGSNSQIAPRLRRKLRALVRKAYKYGQWSQQIHPPGLAVQNYEKELGVKL